MSGMFEQDDIFERYDVPASNSKDFSRTSLSRSSPRNLVKMKHALQQAHQAHSANLPRPQNVPCGRRNHA